MFKASKIELDLTLDLTEFISESDGGILRTSKINGDSIFEWTKITVSEAEKIQEMEKEVKEGKRSMTEITEKSRDSVIRQIDYFYGKGLEFYKKLHLMTLREILEYIRDQVSPVKKKSLKSRS